MKKIEIYLFFMVLVMCFTFQIFAGDSFQNSMDIIFDTSPKGANIKSSIKSFQVLLELDASNFDFSAIKNKSDLAGDLHFATGDSYLPYRVEKFDKHEESARIWILLPELKGYNSSQRIAMLWNKSSETINDPEIVKEINEKISHQKKHMFSADENISTHKQKNSQYGIWKSNDAGGFTIGKK